MSLFIVRAECNWHPLGSSQESTSGSCRQSLFSCAVVGATRPPWQNLMIIFGGWHCDSIYLYCVGGVFIADIITCLQHGSSLGVGVSSGVLLWKQHILGITSWSSVSDGIFIAHVATVEAKCLSQTPLLVYISLAVRVISVVLWWNEASHLWQYVKSHAFLFYCSSLSTVEWAFWGESLVLHAVIRSHTDAVVPKLFLLFLFLLRVSATGILLARHRNKHIVHCDVYLSTWLLNSCRWSLVFNCALMGIEAHPYDSTV